jgi:hypothetical protein
MNSAQSLQVVSFSYNFAGAAGKINNPFFTGLQIPVGAVVRSSSVQVMETLDDGGSGSAIAIGTQPSPGLYGALGGAFPFTPQVYDFGFVIDQSTGLDVLLRIKPGFAMISGYAIFYLQYYFPGP